MKALKILRNVFASLNLEFPEVKFVFRISRMIQYSWSFV